MIPNKTQRTQPLARALLAALLLALPAAPALAEEVVAIQAGKIIPIAGEEIENGTILIQDGRITAIGKDVEVPWDASVIDASDKVVMPGLIEPHSSLGLDQPNEAMPNVPFVSVFEAIDPFSSYFPDSLRNGVTSIHLLPGNDTLIGGQGMIVKPHGASVEDMTVQRNVGLKISLRPTRGRSRMAHISELRRTFEDMKRELEEKEKELEEKAKDGEEAPGTARDQLDIRRRALADLLDGALPAYVYCDNASDVLRAITLSKEHGYKMIPVLGQDGYKAAKLLAEAKLPAIVDPALVTWERDEETGQEMPHSTPTALKEAGVKFALQSTSSTLGDGYLWYQAARAVRSGLPREDALRAITLSAAEILGIADRVGSLEKGKEANLLVLSGDPLDIRTWVETVMIEGEVVYERSKDPTLSELGAGS